MYKFLFRLATFALAFNAYRPWATNISIPDVLYLLALLAFFIESLGRQPKMPFKYSHAFWFPSLLILLGGLIASFRSEFQLASLRVSITQFYIFTIWLSMAVWISQAGGTGSVVNALIAGSTVASAFAVMDFAFGLRTGWSFVTNPNLLDRAFWYRTGGSLGNPNELALYNAVVIPLIMDRILQILSSHNKSPFSWNMLGYGICLLVITAGLIFSGSATGFVGVIVSSGIILWLHLFTKSSGRNLWYLFPRATIFVALLAIMLTISALLYPEYAETVATNMSYQNTYLRATSSSITTRAAFLQKGIDLLIQNPFWGYGMDQTGTGGLNRDDSHYLTDLYVHNTVIQMWMGGGILALIGALLLYWHCLRFSWQAITDFIKGNSSSYLLGLAASIISWVLMDQVQANIYQRYKWLVIALLIGQLRRIRLPRHTPTIQTEIRAVKESDSSTQLPDSPAAIVLQAHFTNH